MPFHQVGTWQNQTFLSVTTYTKVYCTQENTWDWNADQLVSVNDDLEWSADWLSCDLVMRSQHAEIQGTPLLIISSVREPQMHSLPLRPWGKMQQHCRQGGKMWSKSLVLYNKTQVSLLWNRSMLFLNISLMAPLQTLHFILRFILVLN